MDLSPKEARDFLNAAVNPELYQSLTDAWQKRGFDITEMINRTGNYSSRISNKQAIRQTITQEMNVLGKNEIEFDKKAFNNIIKDVGDRTLFDTAIGTGLDLSMNRLNPKDIKDVMNTRWSGEMFSDRVWKNTGILGDRLKSLFTLQQLSNRPTVDLMNELNDLTDLGKYASARIVRTESNAMRSLTEQKISEDLGLTKFRIVATLDSRTSEVCQEKDLTIGLWKDAEVGIDIPPFHPNCRSLAVDYFEDEDYSKLERIAKDPETGKTAYVRGDMTYSEWINKSTPSSKPNSVKNKSSNATSNIDKEKIVTSIIEKHKDHKLTVSQSSDLKSVLDKMTPDQANMYDKLSTNFVNNSYKSKGGAAYRPGSKTVTMDLTKIGYESRIGYSRTSALNTKFHEEFHQLDHILGTTKFADLDPIAAQKYSYLGPVNAMSDIRTVTGQRMIKAIDQDVLGFINSSIDEANKLKPSKRSWIPKTTDISTFGKDEIISTIQNLKNKFNDNKPKAQISILTDAIGLTSSNRVSPFVNGFWGHDASYNKSRGKSGATSETWASFGGAFFTDSDETINVIKSVMPNTWATYQSILEEVIDYCLTSDLQYK